MVAIAGELETELSPDLAAADEPVAFKRAKRIRRRVGDPASTKVPGDLVAGVK